MTSNRLRLSGTVCKKPVRKVSPSGIPHCQFLLEHLSTQEEAGFRRKAWCRMPVIISGMLHQDMTQHIKIGVQLTLEGFISCHQARNGQYVVVLHAEQIKFIHSGD
ncbi:primosomal replication protein N [Pantoea sp. Nvir]|uniref:primosomal replication protein N n=1 Tax=Pantoea sp. Nvir TaxID=2576760 RepID=UPI001357FAF5|nr:primosomal replication protein N [Pantoea sp. Nvir]MXP67102.1 primosomal replication protein N [Pantoea sp. Nvir]CAJ0990787.1 Primosomal replication protein N [Pantoea sp. Nvir]